MHSYIRILLRFLSLDYHVHPLIESKALIRTLLPQSKESTGGQDEGEGKVLRKRKWLPVEYAYKVYTCTKFDELCLAYSIAWTEKADPGLMGSLMHGIQMKRDG